MKIDWSKVKEGFTLQDAIIAENKELKNRIDKVVNDMEDVLQKYTYYDDYSVDASMINFWVEMLLGSESFDDENFKKLTDERNEQLKEIERLNNIIKKALQIAKELQYDIHDESCSHGTKNIDNLVKLLELKGSDKE